MIRNLPHISLKTRVAVLAGFFYAFTLILCVLGLVGLMAMNDVSGTAMLFSFVLASICAMAAGLAD